MWVLLEAGLPNVASVDALAGWGEVPEFPEMVGHILQVSFCAYFGVHSFYEVCVQSCERLKKKEI